MSFSISDLKIISQYFLRTVEFFREGDLQVVSEVFGN